MAWTSRREAILRCFVRVIDERKLLLPERPGNRLADTLTNLLADPRIALLFLIPGVGETFRVNGGAVITDDRELLAGSAVENKVPRLGIVVSVEEAYTQCALALIRSELWNPVHHTERAELPSHGEILKSLSLPGLDRASLPTFLYLWQPEPTMEKKLSGR